MKWWSKTQPTIALSSGEAELAAIVKATSEGLGMLAMMNEFGIKSEIIVKSDAVAAIGIVRRQGLGRIRHLAVADIWIQQKSKDGIVKYTKLPGVDNTSDILTKPVEAPTIEKSTWKPSIWNLEQVVTKQPQHTTGRRMVHQTLGNRQWQARKAGSTVRLLHHRSQDVTSLTQPAWSGIPTEPKVHRRRPV